MIIYLGIKFKIASYFPSAFYNYYFAVFLLYIIAAKNFAVSPAIISL